MTNDVVPTGATGEMHLLQQSGQRSTAAARGSGGAVTAELELCVGTVRTDLCDLSERMPLCSKIVN